MIFPSSVNEWIFMKLILSIYMYDHGVVMHLTFCQDILITEELMSFDFLNIKKNITQP